VMMPVAAAMIAARASPARRGMVGVWSGTVVSLREWWLGRSGPSPVAVAPLLHRAHTGCERA
jgi:hypothetical protein